jgi:hypothetical protein
MSPSIRVTPEGYKGLKKLIDSGYAKTFSGAIDRFVTEEGLMPEKRLDSSNNINSKAEDPLNTIRATNIDQDRINFVAAEDGKSNLNDEDQGMKEMLGDLICKYRYQRDAMRAVFKKFNGDKYKTVKGYKYLEEKGLVKRKHNTHNFNARYYAEALFNDGIKKEWLTVSEDTRDFFRKEGFKAFNEDVDVKENKK